MPMYFSAGVYVREIDLSDEVGVVQSSIGAIVGASKKGPVGGPVLVTSAKQFADLFGTPDPTVSWMHYQALQFLTESNALWVVRAIGSGYTYGGVLLQKKIADTYNVLTTHANASPTGIDFATVGGVAGATENWAYFYNIGPGSYSSGVALEILSDNVIPPTVTAAGITTSGATVPNAAYSYKVTAIGSAGESLASTAATVTTSGGQNSVRLTWPAVARAIGYRVYGRVAGSEFFIGQVPSTVLEVVDTFTALTYTDPATGSLGSITIPGSLTSALGVPPVTAVVTSDFTVRVYDLGVSTYYPVEEFLCSLSAGLDGYGQQKELEKRINPFSNYIRVKSNVAALTAPYPTVYSVTRTTFAAGSSGAAVTSSNVSTGWDYFGDSEETDVQILINAGYADAIVQTKMNTIAGARGDAMAILDMPTASQKTQACLDYRRLTLNLNSNRAALYAPDLLIADTYNNQQLYVPPAGHVAAVYAKTDRLRAPWFAPAGLNRGLLDILGVRYKYNKGDRDLLQQNQINYVRFFPGQGIAVFEARTMQAKQSALSFVNVRRMLDVVEKAISRSVLYDLFEPNDDITRRQIVEKVRRYLSYIQAARGIKAFEVVCDIRNNPPYITAQGQLNLDVYITPILPVEKIQLTAVITRQGANFAELIASGVTL